MGIYTIYANLPPQAGMVHFIGTALAHLGSRALKRSARPKQTCVCGLSFRLQ
jgi:hypothetical protein